MSYTVEKLEKSQVKFVFDVDADTFNKAVDAAYNKTKHKYAIAGFRKGHVPKKVIEGIYGKEVFFEDAMDIVIPEAYSEALDKEKDVDVVAQPELTSFDFKEDGGATFTLIVTVKPDVKLGKYKGLSIEKKVEKVTAKQVDEAVEQAREKQARIVETDEAAKNGDIVNIDFVGSVDGVKFDGGSAESYDLELGSGSFIPGFEEQLVGAKKGEKKDVNVKFPEDYHAEELKGKNALFECTINAVKKKELPALDDEFVKDVSEFDTLAEYKADVKNKLMKDAEDRADREFEDALVQAVVDNADVEVPQAMIDQEAEDMAREFEYRLSYQNIKLDDYLKYLNMTRDQLLDEYKEQAAKSVKVRLVMEAIVKAEELKFEEKDIDEKLADMAARANQDVETFKKGLGREHFDYLANQILSDKLMAMLKQENTAAAKKATAKKAADASAEEKPAAEKKAPAKKPAAKKAEAKDGEAKPAAKKAAKKESEEK
ncbi:MAG: trigger factor [Acutalibacteraceae bacterium]